MSKLHILGMTLESYAHGCIPGFLTDFVKSYAGDPASYIVYYAVVESISDLIQSPDNIKKPTL